MIHRCEDCPGIENLRNYIDAIIDKRDGKVNHILSYDVRVEQYHNFNCSSTFRLL